MSAVAKKRNTRPSSSGLLLFIAAFLGALVLSVGIAYVWYTVAKPDIPWLSFLNRDEPPSTPAETVPAALYDAADRLSVAVYITDEHGVLQTVTLCNICPDTAAVTVCGIPAELWLSSDETDTVARRMRLGGVEKAQEGVSRYFETTVDHYIVLAYHDVKALLSDLDATLIVNLPTDVNEQSENGSFAVHLTAGENALSPDQVSNLLRCTNYQDGRRERATMHARVVEAYVRQFMSASRVMQSDFALVIANADSDWTVEKFAAVQPKLDYILREHGEEWLTMIPASGDFAGVGATLHFTPDAALLDAVEATLRDDTILSDIAQ